MTSYKSVGKIIRVEWDQDTNDVRIVMEITDPSFKKKVLRNKEYEELLSISGKDVMMVASKHKGE